MSYSQVLLTPPPQRTCTFLASGTDSATTNTWTFSGVSLGTASADRIIVIGLGSSNGPLITRALGVTIAGITATYIGAYEVGTPNYWDSELYYALVPTGTTGDLVITWNGTTGGVVYSLWALTGMLSSVPSTLPTNTNYHVGYGANASAITDRNAGGAPVYTGGIGIWLAVGDENTTSNTGTKDYAVSGTGTYSFVYLGFHATSNSMNVGYGDASSYRSLHGAYWY